MGNPTGQGVRGRSKVSEYVDSLKSSQRFGHQVVYHTVLPKSPVSWAKPRQDWPPALDEILRHSGIDKLYRHQSEALDYIRSGEHVVVATPTASGKTLIYNLPVFEKILHKKEAKALYLFPLKALAQDQLKTFSKMASFFKKATPRAEIYDGDTTTWRRKQIRATPPNVVMTNPEMLHLSLLPYHQQWRSFLAGIEIVVVDEVHTYRGVMGSQMAQVFRRFRRICTYYGACPTFVFSSATVANPGQLVEQLTGLKAQTVCRSGAPQGKRHLVFIDAVDGPAQAAIHLLKAALHRKLRTIVYTQSRKMTELISIWAGNVSGPLAKKISAYRAGFLPEERRDIEAGLASGDLLAVVSTSALELGIDIGDLDLCLLVGYPGSIVATWQRGGRVGRSGQDSIMVLISGEDALDQYFMRNPKELIQREPEAAVVNPYNTEILRRHLVCAAAELPLKADEPFMAEQTVKTIAESLTHQGQLLKGAAGQEYFASRKSPHRHVNLRGSGSRFNIETTQNGINKGEIDGFRAFRETHPGAIYLHRGETYLVDALELETRTVKVSQADVSYYTRVRGHKDTEILEIFEEKSIWGTTVSLGRLKVTDQVTGYEKWSIRVKRRINIYPLDFPPQIFETEGIWFKIPPAIQSDCESKYLHFMGGIHAFEHAAIGILPLLVMTDRNDLGGISTTFNSQVGAAAVFIYDGTPGGAGLSREAFARAGALLEHTLRAIAACTCEIGCPSCVHSPKCGSGNRPIDKTAAVFILRQMQDSSQTSGSKRRLKRAPASKRAINAVDQALMSTDVNQESTTEFGAEDRKDFHFGVFDLETQRSAEEVGGWHRAERMGISCAVLYISDEDRYIEFLEAQIDALIERLQRLDLVIGFNIKRFDYRVLRGYSDFKFETLPTLDILQEIHRHLGYRLSLDHLAQVTLGSKKTANGLQALEWWREGRIRDLIEYCRHDVAITRDLFLFGRENQYLLFKNKAGSTVRVPVKW